MFSKRVRKVYVIVPITIPGMNKELFFQPFERIVKEQGFEFSFIANKSIKKEAQETVSKNPKFQKLPPNELKRKGDLLARHLFQENLTYLIQKKLNPGQHHFVYIEKNHPPGSWKKTLSLITDAGGNNEVEIIALVPLSTEEGLSFTFNEETVTFPFSVELFTKCLDTVQRRTDHETLSGSGSESVGILLEFLDFYKDVSIDEKSLKKTKLKYGFDRAIYIPFMDQNQKVVITPSFKETLINALQYEKGSKEREGYSEDLNLLHENSNITFEEPDEETICEYIYDFLESLELLKKSDIPVRNKPVQEKPQNIEENNKSINNKSQTIEENKSVNNEPVKESTILPQIIPKNDKNIKETVPEQAIEFKYDPSKQKTPLYLGVFPKNFSASESKQYITRALDILSKEFPKDNLQDQASLKLVEKPHLVALHIGQDKTKLKSPFYKNFKEKTSVEIKLAACIVIPGKIILSLCPPDQTPVEIEDDYPYLILSQQNWDSSEATNQLLANLLDSDEPFNLDEEHEIAKKTEIEIHGTQETVYFVQTGKHLVLDSETISVRQ